MELCRNDCTTVDGLPWWAVVALMFSQGLFMVSVIAIWLMTLRDRGPGQSGRKPVRGRYKVDERDQVEQADDTPLDHGDDEVPLRDLFTPPDSDVQAAKESFPQESLVPARWFLGGAAGKTLHYWNCPTLARDDVARHPVPPEFNNDFDTVKTWAEQQKLNLCNRCGPLVTGRDEVTPTWPAVTDD